MARSKRLLKVVVALAAVAGLALVFWRSVRETRAEPYQLQAKDLDHWTLGLAERAGPSDPYLVLQAPGRVIGELSNQLFKRAMESMNAPSQPAIPLLLKGEFDHAFAGRVPREQLLAAARSAGLDRMPLRPRCLAYRRVSDPRVTEQLYFVIFDAPELDQFRTQMQKMLGVDGIQEGLYDPAAMSPVLLVSGTGTSLGHWLPLQANPATDCVAPIVVVN